jgi:hypothetical protein
LACWLRKTGSRQRPPQAALQASSAQRQVPDDRRNDLAGRGGGIDAAGPATRDGVPVNLFDGQSILRGSWVVPDGAARAM